MGQFACNMLKSGKEGPSSQQLLWRERSPKRQQPFSAPLPAKGEALVDLSGWDLSKMQRYDCFKVLDS